MQLWGTGEPYREFLYVNDLANAGVFLMQNHNAQNIKPFVNIGTGTDIQIKDLAILIKNIVGFNGSIEYESDKPDGTPRKLLEISKINKLGWKHKIQLKQGIQNTYNWYKKTKENK